MEIKQYGHIKPKEKQCNGCGAVLEYCEPDVKSRYAHSSSPDETEEYINCPVCGRACVLPRWEDDGED